MAKNALGQFEQLVLNALVALRGDGYGLQVYRKMNELSGKEVNLGSMYVTLDRLERKGYVTSKEEKGTPGRGGKKRKNYHLEPAGLLALQEAMEMASRLSQFFNKAKKIWTRA